MSSTKVVFPEPVRPTIASVLPASRSNEMESKALTLPEVWVKETSLKEIFPSMSTSIASGDDTIEGVASKISFNRIMEADALCTIVITKPIEATGQVIMDT